MRVKNTPFLSEITNIFEMEETRQGEPDGANMAWADGARMAEADSANIAAVKRGLNNIAEANEKLAGWS